MRLLTSTLRGAACLVLAALIWAPSTPLAAPEDELPDGEGKKILQVSCTSCHDLREVTKLRGYYNKEQWRDVVATMVEYGTRLEEGEMEVLVDYLTQHLGRQ